MGFRLKPVAQNWNKWGIGGWHWILSQCRYGHPSELLSFLGSCHSLPFTAGKQRHEQVKVPVAMAGERQRSEAAGPSVDAKLFAKFANQCLLWRFAEFDLSARKLPETGHRLSFGTLCEQNPPVTVNQCDGGNKDHLHDRYAAFSDT